MFKEKAFTLYSHVPNVLYGKLQITQYLQQDYRTIFNRNIYTYS